MESQEWNGVEKKGKEMQAQTRIQHSLTGGAVRSAELDWKVNKRPPLGSGSPKKL